MSIWVELLVQGCDVEPLVGLHVPDLPCSIASAAVHSVVWRLL